jgi:hypothetical protein
MCASKTWRFDCFHLTSRSKHGTVEVPFTLTSNGSPTHHSWYTVRRRIVEGWDGTGNIRTLDPICAERPTGPSGLAVPSFRAPCNRHEETPLERRRPDGAMGWSHLVVGLVALLPHNHSVASGKKRTTDNVNRHLVRYDDQWNQMRVGDWWERLASAVVLWIGHELLSVGAEKGKIHLVWQFFFHWRGLDSCVCL